MQKKFSFEKKDNITYILANAARRLFCNENV